MSYDKQKQQRWPLHPKPRDYEILSFYVRRLAACYSITYPTFCLKVLGVTLNEYVSNVFDDPPPEILERLSNGTGVSVDQLTQMTSAKIWQRLHKEVEEWLITSEGQARLKEIIGASCRKS